MRYSLCYYYSVNDSRLLFIALLLLVLRYYCYYELRWITKPLEYVQTFGICRARCPSCHQVKSDKAHTNLY